MSDFENELQNRSKKRKKVFITKLSLIGIIALLIVVYFVTPISKVYNSTIDGMIYLTSENYLSIAGISKSNSLYLISPDAIASSLKQYPLIDESSVKVSVTPMGLNIFAQEISPMFKYNDEYYLTNGNKVDDSLLNNQDEFIKNYMSSYLPLSLDLVSKPLNDKFNLTRYVHLCNIILNIRKSTNTYKTMYVGYDADNYYYDFYYSIDDNTLLKVSFDALNSISIASKIINEDSLKIYLEKDLNGKYLYNDEKIISYTDTFNNKEYNVKGIKVIYDATSLRYQVLPNNK